MDDINHLNPIDRSFYFIQLREKFYRINKNNIGEDEWIDEEGIIEIEIKDFRPVGIKKEYTWEKFISDIDEYLVNKIKASLNTLKISYGLSDLDWVLTNPKPILLNDPNLLAISPFLFTLKDWMKIIKNDLSKIYGKSEQKIINNRDLSKQAKLAFKRKLSSLPNEIEIRTGTNSIKDYKQNFTWVYLKMYKTDLSWLILNLDFQQNLGKENIYLYLEGFVTRNKKQRLRNLLAFNYDKKKIYTIFFIWLDIKKQNKEKRELIKEFIDTFHSSSNNFEEMNIPNLSVFKESRYELLSLIKFLSNWHKNKNRDKTPTEEIVKFKKVENLLPLFRKLQLFQEINNPKTFRDYYYKKTEFPNEAVKRIKHHLH
ncbi:hypothetical protein ACNI3T_09015 [Christiangramia sp. ASW11-125]|uniref:hypothetical protein n=1 Tax=Christiangramia sp. ASW11-125 TaxID=3400701 RepID=UPI003AAE177F